MLLRARAWVYDVTQIARFCRTPSVVSSHDDDTMSQASDFLKSSMRRFKVPEIASRVRSLLRVGRTDKVR